MRQKLEKWWKRIIAVGLVISLLSVGFVIYPKQQKIVLTFGMFAGNKWDVPDDNCYQMIDQVIKEFEKEVFFEACMPIEEMASRGEDTMRFGPLKPVGLIDPTTGKEAYAVAQLRQDDAAASLYNIVGFQTHLTWPEQKRVFGLIPGLHNAEFVRYGVMHKNTYINSPHLLDDHFCLKQIPRYYFAGQMTGVEGYVESASSGLIAGVNVAMAVLGKEPVDFPIETALGALAHYISNASTKNFQPMNINFGLMPPLNIRIRKKREKNALIAERALKALENTLFEMEK